MAVKKFTRSRSVAFDRSLHLDTYKFSGYITICVYPDLQYVGIDVECIYNSRYMIPGVQQDVS